MKELNLEEIIKLDESGYSLKEIANYYETYYQRIQEFLIKNNYNRVSDKHRTHKIKDNYFENIDNETKAYLLGFFAADGGILNDSRIQICLAEIDKHIVELFSNELGLEKELESNVYTKGAKNRQKQFLIRFKSYKMLEDFKKYGIKYKKSLSEMTFINIIPENLQHHFVRGYFDGDGSISNVSKKYKCYICTMTNSTRNILDEISIILTKNNIKHKIYSSFNKTEYFTLYTTSTEPSCKFGNYLYKNSTIFLERKKIKFDIANTVLTEKLKKS